MSARENFNLYRHANGYIADHVLLSSACWGQAIIETVLGIVDKSQKQEPLDFGWLHNSADDVDCHLCQEFHVTFGEAQTKVHFEEALQARAYGAASPLLLAIAGRLQLYTDKPILSQLDSLSGLRLDVRGPEQLRGGNKLLRAAIFLRPFC